MHGTYKGLLTPTRYPRNPCHGTRVQDLTSTSTIDAFENEPPAALQLEGDDLTVPTLLHNFLFRRAIVPLDTFFTDYFLLCRAIVLLDTFVTDYFLFCRAIVLLDTFITDYFLLCRAIVPLDTLVNIMDYFLLRRAIVPLDTVITITSWTTCDSNPDDRLGTGTSILVTS
ncbi:hypothetical protein EV363DRAFT_462381 [Boletus edulis]|nr:hypothetical protein EV363DRAFT_462381 [Boletus edulis]